MINRIIGKRMKMLRKSLNLSQKEFAHYISGKVDYTYIGKIERGKQYPSIKMLERIAHSYGVMVSYFFQANNQSAREVGIRIQIRNVIHTWRAKTQDMLARSTQELDDVMRAAFNESANPRIRGGETK